MRVLLVEDDEGVASALAELLGQTGATVVRTGRGADALHRVKGLRSGAVGSGVCPTWTAWTCCARCGVRRRCR